MPLRPPENEIAFCLAQKLILASKDNTRFISVTLAEWSPPLNKKEMHIALCELQQIGYSPRFEWSDDCAKVLVYAMPDLHASFD